MNQFIMKIFLINNNFVEEENSNKKNKKCKN